MPLDHVCYLMGQNRGELFRGFGKFDQTTVNDNLSARQGEGVHRLTLND